VVAVFKKHPVAVILSVLFHIGLIVFFIVGFDFFDDEPPMAKPPVNIVKATVIDESKVRAAAEKLKQLERKKKLQEKQRIDRLKADRLKEEKKLADLKKKQSNEKKKIEQLKVAEAARLAKLKKQKTEAAKKKAADLKKKQAADKKKKVAADKRKKAEELKKQAIAREKQEQADRLSAMLEAAHNEEQEQMAQKAIASFTDMIRQKVERNWIQPVGDISGLSCVVRVKLIPGGEVVDAQITKSSGNGLFDRSVELATRKASPLPIPDDPALFKQFRNLEFYFQPSK